VNESAGRWAARRAPGGWTVLDAALAAALLVLLVAEIVPNPDMTPRATLVALSVPMTVPLAWRSRWSGAVAVVVCAAALVTNLVATGEFPPQLAVFPVLVAIFSAASRLRGWSVVPVAAVTLALNVAAWVVTDEGAADDFWPWMLWAGAWATGTFVRRREDAAAHHAGRAALLEVEARTAAAESAQRERDRIARELHDVVAHSVSVIVVQAGAERLRLGDEARRTREVLQAIEESGRSALGELRTMLGMLRDAPGEGLAPLRGLTGIPALVDGVRQAGLPLELACEPPDLLAEDGAPSDAAGLAAYRIVQEALTNVVRHAGSVPTRVRLEGSARSLGVLVENDEPVTFPERAPSSGRGILGMRERAQALGGTFEAGPDPRGGFRVVARVPHRGAGTP
jgi:signal transduction histidine kinase